MPAAAGIELVYNFTLVHGDVQSGRPDAVDRPSIWWVWGPAQAINAGDGLHALGRTTTMRLAQRGVPPQQVLQAVQSLDRACLVLCEGQYMDLEFQDRILVTADNYLDMVSRKTGALTGCSAEAGALAAGSGRDCCARFRDFGATLGMAWQISRDVQDLWGRQGDAMTASNVLQKKKSLPLIHALETAPVATKRELGNIYLKRVLGTGRRCALGGNPGPDRFPLLRRRQGQGIWQTKPWQVSMKGNWTPGEKASSVIWCNWPWTAPCEPQQR